MGVYFVSKASVSGWPVIGTVARATGVLFIERRISNAARHTSLFSDRLAGGDRLMFFPEGTSTDGRRGLKFRSSLFASLFEQSDPNVTWVQPVTLNYIAPNGARADFYGWWGDMAFAPHFALILSRLKQGHIEMVFHTPLNAADYPDRKVLTSATEDAVRGGLSVPSAPSD